MIACDALHTNRILLPQSIVVRVPLLAQKSWTSSFPYDLQTDPIILETIASLTRLTSSRSCFMQLLWVYVELRTRRGVVRGSILSIPVDTAMVRVSEPRGED